MGIMEQASADHFLHGIQFVSMSDGARTIETLRSNVLGVYGTAPDADPELFPLNKPVAVLGDNDMVAALGAGGTLPKVFRHLWKKSKSWVVVVRTEEGDDDAETLANMVGGIDDEGNYFGIKAGSLAESETKLKPKIHIAPYFSDSKAVADALGAISDELIAISFIDCPNADASKYSDAITYAEQFGSERIFPVYPWPKSYDTEAQADIAIPGSIMAAAAEVETNYYESSSMTEVSISGLSKPITFQEGNQNTIANLLNEKGITTFIMQKGYRLYGNRGVSVDPRWKFRSHVRLDDSIRESITAAHIWAKDKNITRGYADAVLEGIQKYLRYLASSAVGAISGGMCWLDREINTQESMDSGRVYFDFDYGRWGVAEHIIIRRFLNNGYTEEVFAS